MTDATTGEAPQIDLSRIVVEPKPEGSMRKQAKKFVQQEAQYVSRRAKKLHEDGLEHDLESRKKYGPLIFKLVITWLFLVLGTVWASAIAITIPTKWGGWCGKWIPTISAFDLSDGVLIALVTGATVNVIGLLYAVVKYTFPIR